MSGRHDGRSPDAYGYDRSLRVVLWLAIGLVAVEGTAVDVVVALGLPGSLWVWVVAGAHLYALVLLLGLLASFRTRPHLLEAETLRLRDGVFRELVVPYDAILDVRSAVLPNFGRSGLKLDETGRTALLASGDATVALTLDPRLPILVTGRHRMLAVVALSITADAPGDFVAALGDRLSPRLIGTPPDPRAPVAPAP
ncbi:MAG: hypothetical protein ACRDYD_12825 [Acidimicrobiales bacterium]